VVVLGLVGLVGLAGHRLCCGHVPPWSTRELHTLSGHGQDFRHHQQWRFPSVPSIVCSSESRRAVALVISASLRLCSVVSMSVI
jgi:hypothetical protein